MNKKSLIYSSIVTGFAFLFVLFTVIPMIEGNSVIAYASAFLTMGAEGLIMGIPMVLSFTFALIILIMGVLSILTACNVIRNAKAEKAFRIVNIVLASLTTFLAFIPFLFYVAQGGFIVAFFLQFLVAIPMIVFASMDLHVVKKAAKENA